MEKNFSFISNKRLTIRNVYAIIVLSTGCVDNTNFLGGFFMSKDLSSQFRIVYLETLFSKKEFVYISSASSAFYAIESLKNFCPDSIILSVSTM